MTPEQQALAEGALLTGELLGVGGGTWSVSRAAGDGLSGPAGPVPVGAWAGFVKRAKATQAQPAAPGTPAPATEWHALGASPLIACVDGSTLPLAAGDVLTSQADPALRFAITAPYAVAGYARYIVRQL